jgi:hypothetical protein
MFESKVSQNRKTQLVNNETYIVLWDVRSRAEITKTRDLDNIAVQKIRAKEEEDEQDPVAALIEKLFSEMESDAPESLKLRPFPDISPELAQTRIATILADEQLERLPVLAEIKYYRSREFIDDDILTKSFQKVLGELDGAKLAQGNEEERIEVVKNLLPSEP